MIAFFDWLDVAIGNVLQSLLPAMVFFSMLAMAGAINYFEDKTRGE